MLTRLGHCQGGVWPGFKFLVQRAFPYLNKVRSAGIHLHLAGFCAILEWTGSSDPFRQKRLGLYLYCFRPPLQNLNCRVRNNAALWVWTPIPFKSFLVNSFLNLIISLKLYKMHFWGRKWINSTYRPHRHILQQQ